MEGGELFDRVLKLQKFSEGDAAEVTHQMLLAVNYIHSHGIVHRDIKLENFLYDKPNSNHLKLIDFGFGKVWDPSTKMCAACGTLSYIAPEVLDGAYTNKCDMWGLGVVVFILLSGYMPFHGNERAQIKNIRAGKYFVKPEKWKNISEDGLRFVKSLLRVNADSRPSAQEALESPWIANRNVAAELKVDNSVVDALCQFSQASRFRHHCLKMMAWSLTNEERAQVRQYFLAIDTDKNGTISLGELKKVIEDSYDIADEETNRIFYALDANKDEEIHYSDFLAAMVNTKFAMHDDLLLATFHRFDLDHSGFITAANMRDLLGESHNEQEISTLVSEADQLKDGRISYAEFVSYLRGDPLEHHAQAAEIVLDHQLSRSRSALEKIPSLKVKEEVKQHRKEQSCAIH